MVDFPDAESPVIQTQRGLCSFCRARAFLSISIGLKIKERNTPRPNRIVEARGGCLATAAASLRLTLKSHQTPHSRIREALLAGFHVTRKPVFKSRVTVNRDDEIVPAIVLMQ